MTEPASRSPIVPPSDFPVRNYSRRVRDLELSWPSGVRARERERARPFRKKERERERGALERRGGVEEEGQGV